MHAIALCGSRAFLVNVTFKLCIQGSKLGLKFYVQLFSFRDRKVQASGWVLLSTGCDNDRVGQNDSEKLVVMKLNLSHTTHLFVNHFI